MKSKESQTLETPFFFRSHKFQVHFEYDFDALLLNSVIELENIGQPVLLTFVNIFSKKLMNIK